MTTMSIEQLENQIERLVREHVAACHKAAATAVDRAFRSANTRTKTRRSASTTTTTSRRRPPAEVAALGERLYEAVCANPGEGMKVLMADVGGTARELHRPMTLLKRAGRVRSVGQRRLTRYFPMATSTSETA
jgi:hypothetical protein